jgi:hypothetical protein
MGYTFMTRRGKVYYLHTGPKRGGGIQYFVSTEPEGPTAEAVPEGFEIYETPNGQVYLRRAKPSLIEAAELALINSALNKRATIQHRYLAETTNDRIVIHEGDTGIDHLRKINMRFLEEGLQDYAVRNAHYMPVMRFTLKDRGKRLFAPERFCWRGSVDDWIPIGEAGRLEKLISKYFKHLGNDSFYDMF